MILLELIGAAIIAILIVGGVLYWGRRVKIDP